MPHGGAQTRLRSQREPVRRKPPTRQIPDTDVVPLARGLVQAVHYLVGLISQQQARVEGEGQPSERLGQVCSASAIAFEGKPGIAGDGLRLCIRGELLHGPAHLAALPLPGWALVEQQAAAHPAAEVPFDAGNLASEVAPLTSNWRTCRGWKKGKFRIGPTRKATQSPYASPSCTR